MDWDGKETMCCDKGIIGIGMQVVDEGGKGKCQSEEAFHASSL